MNRQAYTQFGKLFGFFSAGLLLSLSANIAPAQSGNHTTAALLAASPTAEPKAADVKPVEGTPVEGKPVEGKPVDTTNPAQPTQAQPNAAPSAAQSISDVTASNASFTTLNAALKAAGLTDILSSQGPFTVFAPTDEAFAALPKGTVEKLLQPENKDKLVKLLTYHVVSGEVLSSGMKSGNVSSVEGSPIAVKVSNQAVMVNNARVTTADVKTSNGVIHVIDKVIVPPMANSSIKPKNKAPKTAPKSTQKSVDKPVDKPVDNPTEPAPVR
jgi:uncharacterized surface protein with fasciclin (FAS1) repeats